LTARAASSSTPSAISGSDRCPPFPSRRRPVRACVPGSYAPPSCVTHGDRYWTCEAVTSAEPGTPAAEGKWVEAGDFRPASAAAGEAVAAKDLALAAKADAITAKDAAAASATAAGGSATAAQGYRADAQTSAASAAGARDAAAAARDDAVEARDAAIGAIAGEYISVDTLAELNANATALRGDVMTGADAGFYVRATTSDPWVKKSDATLSGLAAAAASLGLRIAPFEASFAVGAEDVRLLRALRVAAAESPWAPALFGDDGLHALLAFYVPTGEGLMRMHQLMVDGITKDNLLKFPTIPESHMVGAMGADGRSLPLAFDSRTGELYGRPSKDFGTAAFSVVRGREMALYGGERLGPLRSQLIGLKLGTVQSVDIPVEGTSWDSNRHWITDASRYLCDSLGAGYGYGGHGWWPAGTTSGIRTGYAATYAGDWSSVVSILSPHQDFYRSSTPRVGSTSGDLASFYSPFAETAVTICARAGAFRYRFNGGAWTTVTIVGDSLQFFPLTGIPTPAGTPWTLDVETIVAPFDLVAVHLRNPTGVRFDRLSRAGTSTKEMVAVDETVAVSTKAFLAPSLAIAHHGVNDQLLTGVIWVTPDECYANIKIWAARQRAAKPDVALLVATNPQVRYGAYPQSRYSEAMRQAAVEDGLAHLDFQPLFGDYDVYRYGGSRPLLDDSGNHTDQNGDNVLIHGAVDTILGKLS
jgi:hypothetical protein